LGALFCTRGVVGAAEELIDTSLAFLDTDFGLLMMEDILDFTPSFSFVLIMSEEELLLLLFTFLGGLWQSTLAAILGFLLAGDGAVDILRAEALFLGAESVDLTEMSASLRMDKLDKDPAISEFLLLRKGAAGSAALLLCGVRVFTELGRSRVAADLARCVVALVGLPSGRLAPSPVLLIAALERAVGVRSFWGVLGTEERSCRVCFLGVGLVGVFSLVGVTEGLAASCSSGTGVLAELSALLGSGANTSSSLSLSMLVSSLMCASRSIWAWWIVRVLPPNPSNRWDSESTMVISPWSLKAGGLKSLTWS